MEITPILRAIMRSTKMPGKMKSNLIVNEIYFPGKGDIIFKEDFLPGLSQYFKITDWAKQNKVLISFKMIKDEASFIPFQWEGFIH